MDEEEDERQLDHYTDEIELSFMEELSFFLQFFLHLMALYSICYLCSMHRFLREQAGHVAQSIQPVIQFAVRPPMAAVPLFGDVSPRLHSTRQMGQASSSDNPSRRAVRQLQQQQLHRPPQQQTTNI